MLYTACSNAYSEIGPEVRCDLSRLLSRKITKRIHSSKPASLVPRKTTAVSVHILCASDIIIRNFTVGTRRPDWPAFRSTLQHTDGGVVTPVNLKMVLTLLLSRSPARQSVSPWATTLTLKAACPVVSLHWKCLTPSRLRVVLAGTQIPRGGARRGEDWGGVGGGGGKLYGQPSLSFFLSCWFTSTTATYGLLGTGIPATLFF